MITGLHAIVFSPEAEKVRAFFADVVGLSSADAGGGWLIFALPPAELAVHPADGESRHELYLMCDNIQPRRFSSRLGPGQRHLRLHQQDDTLILDLPVAGEAVVPQR